jgi:hypothetical protein
LTQRYSGEVTKMISIKRKNNTIESLNTDQNMTENNKIAFAISLPIWDVNKITKSTYFKLRMLCKIGNEQLVKYGINRL